MAFKSGVLFLFLLSVVNCNVRITGISSADDSGFMTSKFDDSDYDGELSGEDEPASIPFEAVFQGVCKDFDICVHTCFNLHDGTFECNCHPGYTLDANGYSCFENNDSNSEDSVLYEKDASFVALLDEKKSDGESFSQFPVEKEEYIPKSHDRYYLGDGNEEGFKSYEMQNYRTSYYDDSAYDSSYDDSVVEEPRVLPDRELPDEVETKDEGYMEELEQYITSKEPNNDQPKKSPFSPSSYLNSESLVEEEERIEIEDGSSENEEQEEFPTSLGPNLEQKVPSEEPKLQSTPSLEQQCDLDCGSGKCIVENKSDDSDEENQSTRCQCPLGYQGAYCRLAPRIDVARFHGKSWMGFAPLREAYKDVQITLEFKPEMVDNKMNLKVKPTKTPLRFQRDIEDDYNNFETVEDAKKLLEEDLLKRANSSQSQEGLRGTIKTKNGLNAVLLVSGENDDLSGDFMAATIVDGIVEFRWDCGSGVGIVKSEKPVRIGEWNRLSVYRHRWDVWLQLNNGNHIQGRSEGLFSRITFREPLYVGGSYNLTSLYGRLGVNQGLVGCVRKLQVNDHIYQFFRATADTNSPSEYGAQDGWDISECLGDVCSSLFCQNGGKCIVSPPSPTQPPTNPPMVYTPVREEGVCYCPLGYTGDRCETQLNLEVPSFNGTSYLSFPPLGTAAVNWLELKVVFKSSSMDGSIVYAGHRSDATGDYISLKLSDAHVIFTIDLGSGTTTLRSSKPIRPGVWHTVHVSRTGHRVWMYVDDQPTIEGFTPGGFTRLTLSQPMYLGGLPDDSSARRLFSHGPNLIGCIQKLVIGDRPLHLFASASSGRNVGSCNHPCSRSPCHNGGVCEPIDEIYECKCPMGFTDKDCRSQVVTEASTPKFGGKSFLKFTHPEIMKRVTGDKLHMWFRFKTSASTGLLIWIGEDNFKNLNDPYLEQDLLSLSLGDCLSLEMKDGRLVLRYNLGSGFGVLKYNSSVRYDDGAWHVVRLARFERQAQMTVDNGPELISFSPGDLVQLNVDSALYIGGRESYHSSASVTPSPGLDGCVSDLTLATDYHVDLITSATAGQNIEYC